MCIAIKAITPKINPVNNKSGSLNNLSFAVLDSITAIAIIRISTFRITRPKAIKSEDVFKSVARPQGKNRFEPSKTKNMNLFALAHSISASLFPEYSKIIAS